MIALPRKWVQEMGLQQGYPITITRTDSKSLLISVDEPDTRIVRNGNVLDTSENDTPESIFRRICALYVAGSTEIRIRAKSGMFRPPQKDMLRDLVRNRLIGTEIA
jgi:phosphate uptake regulator